MPADVVIHGGDVIDGTGAPARRVDIAVTGSRITAIGPDLRGPEVDGAHRIDATGMVVSPGFIDIHTHFDAQVLWDPALSPSCYHGVTTVIAGNCGLSLAPLRPDHRTAMIETLELVEDMDKATLTEGIAWNFESFPEYLDAVNARGTMLNFTAFLGHTPLRMYVMGDDYQRAATDEEIERMCALTREALAAGAAGISTSFGAHVGAGGTPVASRFADMRELEALGRTLTEVGRGVMAVAAIPHLGYDATYELARRTGAPITIVALVSLADGTHEKQLAIHRQAVAEGVRVWPQVSPLPIVSDFSMARPTRFNSNPVFADLGGVDESVRRAGYADPEWRERAAANFSTTPGFAPRPATYMISRSATHPENENIPLLELAQRRGTSWLDTLLDLSLEEPGLALRVLAPVANDDTDVVAKLLGENQTLIGLSDAGAHVTQICDAVQPSVLLATWVRDRGVLDLPTAVRKLSGQQADVFALSDRGYIKEGYFADLVVFDPAQIGPGPKRRINDLPAGGERLTADAPTGIAHVLVNGVAIRSDGAMVTVDGGPRPGQIAT